MKIKLTQKQLEKAAQNYLFEAFRVLQRVQISCEDQEALEDSFRDVIRYCTAPNDKRLKDLDK